LHWIVKEDVPGEDVGSEVAPGEDFLGKGSSATELPDGIGATSKGRLSISAADRVKQEDARRIEWTEAGGAAVALVSQAPLDLQSATRAGQVLGFDYRPGPGTVASVTLRMGCGGSCGGKISLGRLLAATRPAQWAHVTLPLSCFAHAGAEMGHILQPFALESRDVLELSIANVQLERAGAQRTSPPSSVCTTMEHPQPRAAPMVQKP
jgi:beta-glucosidase